MEILTESKRRIKYAKKLIEKLNIMETLEKYGDPLLIGSVAMEVFWKRDIDIVVKTTDIRGASVGALEEFLKSKNFSKYQYGDMVDYPRESRPEGYIVNLFHEGTDGELWEMEIWFLEDITYYEEQLQEWERNIETEDREDIILRKARGDIEEKVL